MARFAVGAAAAVVSVGCLVTSSAVAGSVRHVGVPSGQIAFDSGGGCPFACNVEVMEGDGSGRHKVARGFLPTWSPDGSQLAFWGPASYGVRLTVLDLRTGRRRQFSRSDADHTMATPAWSPDGSRLAFIVPHGGNADLSVVTLDDGRVTRVATLVYRGSYDNYPSEPSPVAWSPDGQSIVYSDPVGELVAVPASGGPTNILISNAALAAVCASVGTCGAADNPAFSPDGSMMAFDSGGNLYVANSDGSNPRQLITGTPPNVNLGGAPGPPLRWSSDGSQIAYGEVRQPCGYSSIACDAAGHPCPPPGHPCAGTAIIRVVVGDGTAEPLLPLRQADLENPAWSPNDHWLVFDNGDAIWRVRDDGTCLRRLAGDIRGKRYSPRDPVWRPGAGSPNDACS
jgi:Tol biopolymer transport system component